MESHLFCGDFAKIREVGAEFSVRGQKVQRLEFESRIVNAWNFWKTQTVFLARHRECVTKLFITEKMI